MYKILLIDDEHFMLDLYKTAFEKNGYQIITSIDGEEGMVAAKTNKPDLILLDIMMPKMSGLEVLDKLKADPEIKNIPVIVLSNLANPSDTQAALTKGALKYIVKSDHSPQEVCDMAKSLLEKK